MRSCLTIKKVCGVPHGRIRRSSACSSNAHMRYVARRNSVYLLLLLQKWEIFFPSKDILPIIFQIKHNQGQNPENLRQIGQAVLRPLITWGFGR